jgi:hypothetical protein
MVKSASGKSGLRSFTVVNATKRGACKTKFGTGGLYKSRTPVAAAKKAFNELCRTKRIRGVCTLFITVRETTRDSKKKEYVYKLIRNKLKKPILLEGNNGTYSINYKSQAKSVSKTPNCKLPGQSRGRRLTRTARKLKPLKSKKNN